MKANCDTCSMPEITQNNASFHTRALPGSRLLQLSPKDERNATTISPMVSSIAQNLSQIWIMFPSGGMQNATNGTYDA
jgi:hypothetical protein